MKKYIRTNIVEAKPMTRGEYNDYRGWTLPADENGEDAGYLVQYHDGYVSWCPQKEFDECSREITGMSFGYAIEMLKHGKKLARAGWNGKSQYIELASNISYVNRQSKIINVDHEAIGNQAIAFVGTSGVQLGWLASQADMLADDWVLVE